MKRTLPLAGMLALIILVACGGGGGGTTVTPPPPTWATSLAYTDPAGTGFRLVKNSGLSTPSKLVLDLTGPGGQRAQGLSFIFNADPAKVQWGLPQAAGGLVQSLAFDVSGPTPALVGNDKGGGNLHGAVYQKSGSQALNQPLVRVCLELRVNSVTPNAAVGLAFTAGNMLSDTGTVPPITVALGTCVAR